MVQALDANLLISFRCYFGGGTAIVLRYGEYRESRDIDFLVSDIDGYRQLRQLVIGPDGINALTHHPLTQLREVRADQYGIRTLLEIDGEPIKFEIIHEGRISLDTPGGDDQVCGVATLTRLDTASSKLLANADRWADRSVFSRDLIDLAMMQPTPSILDEAVAKTDRAYGDSTVRSLHSAVAYLRDDPSRLDECMSALGMWDTPKALLWQRITILAEYLTRGE
ncbi:nucleotidyl transferase AbiEii/AbiGii toxin family protein [Mycobacterium sp. URHB0044]|uniref:nucleotidyl transferase AbiEii/AbiGii toxin family protein n=1 Tax=Mycobacterium sp. URHB0044 TaxID=1380386 RepID=UPI000A53650D|nr:nucleotidyl transferase AbiEii/AbiGii toxin family protein [Mycobacterium sp. URHB0044]